ncbi:hypothetical protein [Desertivirga arenae]|uniref:hypothetical protein n=1 Tax=Desertivirga arenae TaxID=2810309 RepID=UPI001F61D09C|nr:hypothetical protein [Pedobacter sp. SYSU D00823]
MQRVRMSLPYFEEFGWEVEVVSVEQRHSDFNKDKFLTEALPFNLQLHAVNAFSKKLTSKIGLGSIAIRSLWYYKEKVNFLLETKKFDCIYFSTTQFPVCILGAYWKKKYKIPYVIDMQDPWHSDYYKDKPKNERPPKYWFAYNLNKILEPIALKSVDGLISVSEAYISTLKKRYPVIQDIPSSTITFGAFAKDFEIANKHEKELPSAIKRNPGEISIVYVGRGGKDMHPAVKLFFNAFKEGLDTHPEVFKDFKMYFIGTSYAAAGEGKQTIKPLAKQLDLDQFVEERTDRISFYQTLNTLRTANVLFIPGSDDPQYTASKIYPYLMAERPLISIFHPASSAAKIIKDCETGLSLTFGMEEATLREEIKTYLTLIATGKVQAKPPKKAVFEEYSAKTMTKKQVELFEQVLQKRL